MTHVAIPLLAETAQLSLSLLILIPRSFLGTFVCKEGSNVGLLKGRYSAKSLPFLYWTPHALQRVARPIGPSRHWGVLVDSQCRHFFTAFFEGFLFRVGSASRFWSLSPEPDCSKSSIFFVRRVGSAISSNGGDFT